MQYTFAISIEGEAVLAKASLFNAGLISHGRTYPWVWVLCAGPHSPLAFLSGSWAHATQRVSYTYITLELFRLRYTVEVWYFEVWVTFSLHGER